MFMQSDVTQPAAGLGLRRSLLDPVADLSPGELDFLEVAPENWITIGGRAKYQFERLAERYPIFLHGLSLNIGGTAPLDTRLLRSIKRFIETYHCPIYSEHLTYCGDEGHLYDLMPIPFTEEAVRHVVRRIKQVQDILGQRIVLENASYYCAPYQQMSEHDFIAAVLTEADCDLLLDVNNIVVNSVNHGYDADAFLQALPLARARYVHIAGHDHKAEGIRIDTHGEAVIESVWNMLAAAYAVCGPLPTLLERDFNVPPIEELLQEVAHIRTLQKQAMNMRDDTVIRALESPSLERESRESIVS